uniref:Uncharacterized protein n=1 Tax=Arundo donax TaxID=35708 RepID=A0A0A9FJA1_ARUDO
MILFPGPIIGLLNICISYCYSFIFNNKHPGSSQIQYIN